MPMMPIEEFVDFLVNMFPLFFIICILIVFLVVLLVRDNERSREDFK